MSESYKPSGRFGAACIPMTLVVGLAAALVGGFVYQKIVDFVPFIYVNFLLTIGLGYGLAWVIGFTLERGKCRHLVLAAVLAALCGGVAVAASFYSNYKSGQAEIADELERQVKTLEGEFVEGDTPESLAESFTFGEWIDLRVEHGWEIMGAITLSGVFVWIIWLIEFGIIVGLPLFVALAAAWRPFCEPCTNWAEQHALGTIDRLTSVDIDQVRGATNIEPYLGVTPSEGDRSLAFVVHACPTCEVTRFAQVNEIWHEDDGKGSVTEKNECLVTPLRLSRPDAEALLGFFKNKPPEPEPPPPPPPQTPEDWHTTEGTG